MAVEIFGEQLLARRDRFGLVHPVEAQASPRFLRTFDNEGRAVRCEAVGVRPDPAVLRLLEGEGEGVADLPLADPDNLVAPYFDIDTTRLCSTVAQPQ